VEAPFAPKHSGSTVGDSEIINLGIVQISTGEACSWRLPDRMQRNADRGMMLGAGRIGRFAQETNLGQQ
jgi:hypothetical protein